MTTLKLIEPANDVSLTLFGVSSFIRHHHHGALYERLNVTWFVAHRSAPPVPYDRAIAGYRDLDEEGRDYAEGVVDECFTRDEAMAFADHLIERYGKDTHDIIIRLLKAPLDLKGAMPLGAMPCGGGVDIMELPSRLPFRVCAYYDTRGTALTPDDDAMTFWCLI